MAGRGNKARGNISYVKPAEPSFIKRMKQQVGFKEGPTVDTKREQLPQNDDDDDDINVRNKDVDDEEPQVVVLGPGDLTREEADEIIDRLEVPKEQNSIAGIKLDKTEEESRDVEASGVAKISFRKPEKRQSVEGGQDDEDNDGLNVSSSKKRRRNDSDSKRKVNSEMRQVNNRSLLSFNDDEDDD